MEVTDYLESGGTGVDEDGVTILDVGGGGPADGLLLAGVHELLEVEVPLLDFVRGVGIDDGSAVDTEEQFPFLQNAEVFPDGHFRYAEFAAQFGHVDRGFFAEALKDGRAAALCGIVDVHGQLIIWVLVSQI